MERAVRKKKLWDLAKADLQIKPCPGGMCFEKSSKNYLNVRIIASNDASTYLIKDMRNAWVIADKGYDRNAFVEKLLKKGCIPVISFQKKSKTSPKLCRAYL